MEEKIVKNVHKCKKCIKSIVKKVDQQDEVASQTEIIQDKDKISLIFKS